MRAMYEYICKWEKQLFCFYTLIPREAKNENIHIHTDWVDSPKVIRYLIKCIPKQDLHVVFKMDCYMRVLSKYPYLPSRICFVLIVKVTTM